MKKTLLAAALIAGFAGVAQAQTPATNVTLYGIVDEGITYKSIDSYTGHDSQSITGVDSGIQSGSRWGLKGSEDLGGGLKANFVLESGFNADTGSSAQGGLLFGRQSFVGLSGGFGEVRLGRQMVAGYELATLLDPFGAGFGSAGMQSTFSSANALRVNNAAVYRSPVVNGFLGVVGYSFNALGTEVAGLSNNTHATTVGLGYLNGPLALLASYEQVNVPASADDIKHWWVGGTYDLKVVKLAAAYGQDKNQQGVTAPVLFGSSNDSKQYMLGVTVPLGAGSLLGEFQNRDDKTTANKDGRVVSVGYTYPLSARTNVYTYLADVDGKNGNDNVGIDRKEFAVGVRHTF